MPLTPSDIERNQTVANCPFCKGKGTILEEGGYSFPTKNPNRSISFTQARLCICRKNELVENSSTYFNPKTTKAITEKVAEGMSKAYSFDKNRWFTGPIETAMNIWKAVFVYHRQNSSLVFQIANGLELLQNYYVEQTDGAERTLNDLINGRDLLVIMCISTAHNKALAQSTMQIVQGRQLAGKSTWIYTPEDFKARTEYTPELQNLIQTWTANDLTPKNSQNQSTLNGLMAGMKNA
jgi:hypothetical protein